MPRNPKQHRSTELERLATSKPIDTDAVGFAKTLSNNPSPKSSTKTLKKGTPIFNERYFEAFDYCVVFPSTVKNPDTKVPVAESKKLIMKCLRGRKGVYEEFHNPKSLHGAHQLSVSEASKEYTNAQLHVLFLDQFRLILDYIGAFYHESINKDESKIFFRIKFTEASCKSHAEIRNYPMQLATDVTQFDNFKKDQSFSCPYIPYERSVENTARSGNAYATLGYAYQRFDRLSRPYSKADTTKDCTELSIFRDVDRVRLLERSLLDFINLTVLEENKYVSSSFALHQPAALDSLKHEWGSPMKVFSWNQPLDQIRDYYGEKTAFYYSWLGSYCEALTIPAFFGFILMILELVFDRNLDFNQRWINWCRLFYCIILGSWATFFLQRTLRNEKELKLRWGAEVVTGATVTPTLSPWFKPELYITDPVKPTRMTSAVKPTTKYTRKIISNTIACALGALILVVVNDEAVEAFLKSMKLLDPAALSWEERFKEAVSPYFAKGAGVMVFMAFLPVVLFVKITSKFWDKVIIQNLSKFENHKYLKSYYNAIIKKSFVLKFLSHLIPIVYLAFLKETFGNGCYEDMEDGRCIRTTRHLLQSFFVSGLTMNVVEVFKPFIVSTIKSRGFLGLFKKPTSKDRKPYFEAQLDLATYKTRNHFKNFQEVMLNFSFVCLFGVVFPILPVVAFIAAMVEIRSDAYSLTRFYKRVSPEEADDLSTWNTLQRIVTFAGVIVNVLLCGLVTVGYNHTVVFKLCFSLVALLIVLSFKEFISFRVPVESKSYRTQKARCHIVTYEAIWGHKEANKDSPYNGDK